MAANTPFFQSQISNISTQGDTGNLDVSQYDQLLIEINVTALTGTSVTFKLRSVDTFGAEYSLVSTSAQTTTGTILLTAVGSSGQPIGDIVRLEWDPSSATFSANISIYAKG